jgi:hypothetical protein
MEKRTWPKLETLKILPVFKWFERVLITNPEAKSVNKNL